MADIRDILHSLRSQKDDSMTQPLIDAVNKFIGCGFVCGDFQPTEWSLFPIELICQFIMIYWYLATNTFTKGTVCELLRSIVSIYGI